ncbi:MULTISPECIES: peroxiredoxin-like family protein [unclassified Microcella]|uniref:peroxiredoxin-like family protein n=1 Tax=unclassified Microcella TaxID=2630066 RepID=UPI0006F343DB|nr:MULTISPECIES: peroxiredoxin-like family protein [unclassified Microcella]KQV26281.1 peroxiredoxin [Yonghaparkia sp. Root332]KRF32936.1 peroxiredoxin [Yonghaparkia sp. Soil809]
MTTDTTTSTIADEIAAFLPGFSGAIGPELSAVFEGEQADLRAAGAPAEAAVVGAPLPRVSVLDADGTAHDLDDLLGDGVAVLVFYRGAWCPFCNITLRHYQQTLAPALEERGARLIAISPQRPEGTGSAVENGELGFAVVSDPGNALAGALGIVTAPSEEAQRAHTALGFAVKDSNADDSPAIPYPSVIVVDADRRIAFVDIKADYTQRTETPDILAAVDAL